MTVGQFHRRQRARIDDRERRGALAVDELRAKLNGKGKIGEMQRRDTAADAIPRFD
jgi:hypothetical protein